jgi:hypothetical protein
MRMVLEGVELAVIPSGLRETLNARTFVSACVIFPFGNCLLFKLPNCYGVEALVEIARLAEPDVIGWLIKSLEDMSKFD